MKKTISCLAFLGLRMQTDALTSIASFLPATLYPLSAIILGMNFDYIFWLCLFGAGFGAMSASYARLKQVKVLPFSDRRVVGCILMLPIIAMCFILLCFGLVFGLESLWLGDLYLILGTVSIPGQIVNILLGLGIGYIVISGQFYRDTAGKIISTAVSMLMILAIHIAAKVLLSPYKDEDLGTYFDLSQLYLACPIWLLLVVGLAFVLLTGFYAYRRGFYYLRKDIRGQKKDSGKAEIRMNNLVQQQAKRLKDKNYKWKIVLIVLGSLVMVYIIIIVVVLSLSGVLTGGNSVKLTANTREASDYDLWYEGYITDPDLDREALGDLLDYMSIFPESIDEDCIDEYYASIDMNVAREWTSMDDVSRFLKATYDEEEYQQEKDRIKNITVTLDNKDSVTEDDYGKVNHMLEDKTDFSYDTYIAQYNPYTWKYEYAMFDDATSTVYYVYTINELKDLEKKVGCKIRPSGTDIISKAQQNEDNGYVIYDFEISSDLPDEK